MQLMQHQQKGVEIARRHTRFAFFWKPGTGKTITMLAIWRERPRKTLVVAQRSIINTAWRKDAEIMGVPCTVVYSHNRTERLRNMASPGNGVYVINYEQFKLHVNDLLKAGFERVIFDESSKIKNRDSQVTKTAILFADHMQEVYLLSGTPAPNCLTELWAQLRVMSAHASGHNFFKWAYAWFVPRMQVVKGRSVIRGWAMKSGLIDQFNAAMREWSWALRKEDCLDLPPQVDKVLEVTLSSAEAAAYNSIVKDLRATLPPQVGGFDSLENDVKVAVEAANMKLRQITGGSIIVNGSPVMLGSSKLDEMMEYIYELGDEKVVIWAEFTSEIDRIADRLRGEGLKVDVIDGRTREDITTIVDRFVNGDTRYIVAHPKAAGHGTDGLQRVCSHSIFYSVSYSSESHEQARDRIHRNRQTRSCTYAYLVVPGTVDEGLIDVVRKKTTRQDAMLRELNRR